METSIKISKVQSFFNRNIDAIKVRFLLCDVPIQKGDFFFLDLPKPHVRASTQSNYRVLYISNILSPFCSIELMYLNLQNIYQCNNMKFLSIIFKIC